MSEIVLNVCEDLGNEYKTHLIGNSDEIKNFYQWIMKRRNLFLFFFKKNDLTVSRSNYEEFILIAHQFGLRIARSSATSMLL